IDSQYLDDAENVLEDLQKLDPQSPRTAYYQGVIYQGRNKHQAALAEFDKSIALKPGASEPMAAKVKSYIALKQIDEAIAWLAGMEGGDQPNPVALNLQGELHMAKKSWDKARQYFQRCVDAKPEWWIPYRNRAMVESAEKNADSAYQYLAGVVDAVDSAPLRIEMANYAERSGRYDSAIQQYESVLAKNADNQVIANNLAMLIVTYKKDAQSLNRAKQLADSLSASDNPSFLDTAGWVQSVAGDYQRALPMIQQALRAAPDDPAIQYHLAMTYLGASDKANAERYLERALESDRKFHGREEAEKILAQLKQQS
ncbi:MAG: tetratricopeptide repeat protein, partial [Pseudomonadota bacterium]